MKILKYFGVVILIGAWVISAALSGQMPKKVDFRRDVQPLLKQYCIECHGPSQQMHGLRLDRRRDAMRGGTISVIAPGNGAASRLYLKLIGTQYGPQMPPTGPLDAEQIGLIKAWIDQGAQWPDEVSGEVAPAPADPKAVQIMAALRDGEKQVFKRLLVEHPESGNLRGPGGTTPLMQAALYADSESVRLLLEAGANPNIKNDSGATALMWAANDVDKVRLLLDHGADVNARSDDGRTPLIIASGQFGSSPVMKLLLDHGAKLSVRTPTVQGFSTPLSEVSRTGDESMIRILAEHGIRVNADGFQALGNAAKANCTACLETLMKDADRDTLTKAAITLVPPRGDGRGIKQMLDRGADANAHDAKGLTLLMLAASSDAIPLETVRALIARGADVNAQSPEGKPALYFAKLRGSTAVVDLLTNSGARKCAEAANPVFNPKPSASYRSAIERSIPLLQKVDSIFTQKSGCVSCHNNSLTAMSIAIARRKGVKVDEKIARAQLQTIGAYLESWRERVLQGGTGIPGESGTESYILMGLAAENYPPDGATDALARHLLSRQLADGRWQPFAYRPPIESNNISITAASLRALQVYGLKSQREKYQDAIRRAETWLMKAQPRTTEERAFHLLGLGWAGVNAKSPIIRKSVRDLLAEQRSDGGWAQIPSLASDAYATGQALVALNQAGALPVTDPAYKRGAEFLRRTQFEDGSWYIKSRAIPIQPYFDSGFPYGEDQWISTAGTNWATMALALAAGRRSF